MTYKTCVDGVTRDCTPEEIADIEARAAEGFAASVIAAISRTYADVDRVYADAVGNRTEEYKDAEADARAFAAAGYTGTPSDYVHDYALHNPTGSAQTDQWAADQIIARADAFAQAKLAMRSTRFASQAAIRAAATPDDLNAAVATWNGFIASLRTQLGL